MTVALFFCKCQYNSLLSKYGVTYKLHISDNLQPSGQVEVSNWEI